MSDWTIDKADELYRISRWGEGYFSIRDDGKLTVVPIQGNPEVQICVQEVVDELREQNVQFPVVVRFHDILRNRVRELNEEFQNAITAQEFQGVYRGVFPIKVNQTREVVDEIVDAGRPYHYGLEAGSKAELMAVLTYDVGEEALTICNGYKDEDFLRMALLGNKLGRKVIVVIEKFSEIAPLLRLAREMDATPMIGLRIKMRVQTEGRWSSSSGDRAKFGLTISEILNAITYIKAEGFGDCIKLLHFHVGSQLSNIRYVQDAAEEASRIYARLRKRGIGLEYLDIGGGLAVDYDGSRTSTHSSMNYSLSDYAANVIHSIKQVCDDEEVPHPNVVSESGRAITAHHSCVIMRVIGEITNHSNPISTEEGEDEHYLVSNMRSLVQELADEGNDLDIYNQASKYMEDVLSAFKLGVLGMEELAKAETIFWQVMNSLAKNKAREDAVSEELENLDSLLASQYLCNFSLFQSAADSWAIGQVLPITPLSRLNEEPTKNCTIADITCDSDGKIKNFISEYGESETLALHQWQAEGEPYYLGLFLTGAYQDVMGDMHNLFGRLNEAHVFCDDDDPSDFYIEEFVPGSSAAQVLEIMQYSARAMADQVKRSVDQQVKNGRIKSRDGVKLVDFYEQCLASYTYLRQARS